MREASAEPDHAVKRTALPFGSTSGQKCPDSPRSVSTDVKTSGSPPAAGTRNSPRLATLGEHDHVVWSPTNPNWSHDIRDRDGWPAEDGNFT